MMQAVVADSNDPVYGFVNEVRPEHAKGDGDDSRSVSPVRSRQACWCGAATF
jgi:hypothetical protein